MKFLYLSIIVIATSLVLPTAFGSGINTMPDSKFHAVLDKNNYQNSEKPLLSIFTRPNATVNLLILDSHGLQKLDKNITLENGTATYSFDISSYSPGICSVIVEEGTDKIELNFAVGLTPTGGGIVLNTVKDSYLPGDHIIIVGTANSNSLLQITLTDPNGQMVKSIQTFTDKTGHFSSFDFSIPQTATPGMWKLDGTSGVSHSSVNIAVKNDTDIQIDKTIIPSPLKQFKSGIAVNDVKCGQGLQLIMKVRDESPACVKPDTAQKLIERGWTKEIVSTNHARATQMELKAYGFVCCGLGGDLLKGYLSTSNSFVSNATVQISTNGIVMGYAKTFSDGCFQFNQWNESKLSEQTDAFLENEKKWGVYKPFNLTFTAHFAGDKNYGPSTMQTASTMSLTAVPMAPPQLETTLTPTQVNLTQGSSTNFQISIRPMVEQWDVPHLNLYLEGYPCETDFRLSQSSDNTTASTTHPALFDGTMSASTDSPEGKYFVHMMQNGTNHFVANDIGTFPLNIMKMK